MANLNFKIEGNSESFIKETEQIDSSIRTLATDIPKIRNYHPIHD